MKFLDKILGLGTLRHDLNEKMQHLFGAYLKRNDVVYDIGCGEKPFAAFLSGRVKSHIGVDLENGFYSRDKVDLIGSAYDVPAPDHCADAIISSQVLEHLERPQQAIHEAYRLLKPDGLLFLSFPFLYPLHAMPHDHCRFTEFQLRDVLLGENFEILELHRIGGFWYLMGLYTGMYIQVLDRRILKKYNLVRILMFLVRMPFYLMHLLEGFVLKILGKKPESLRARWTVNYVVLARKKTGATA